MNLCAFIYINGGWNIVSSYRYWLEYFSQGANDILLAKIKIFKLAFFSRKSAPRLYITSKTQNAMDFNNRISFDT